MTSSLVTALGLLFSKEYFNARIITLSPRINLMSVSVFIIHGVGNFDQEIIEADTKALINPRDDESIEFSIFNWDDLAGKPIDDLGWNHQWLLDINTSIRNIIFSETPNSGTSSSLNILALSIISTISSILPLILFCNLAIFIIYDAWGIYYKWAEITGMTSWSELAGKNYWIQSVRLCLILLIIQAGIGLLYLFIHNFELKNGKRLIMIHVRKILLAYLWPYVFFMMTPIIFFRRFLVGFAIILFISSLSSSDSDSSTYFMGVEFPSTEWSAFFGGIFLWLPIVLGMIIFYNFIIPKLSPLLKALGDVVKYLGSDDHRNHLQNELIYKIASNGKDKDVFIIAHSLGTVIASDALCNESKRLCNCNSINLITMGSPLKRLFHFFFPDQYSHPKITFEKLSNAYSKFRWVNIYRPYDPIGSAIGLPRKVGAHEATTKQNGFGFLFVGAHTNYWSDKVVRDAAFDALDKTIHARSSTNPLLFKSILKNHIASRLTYRALFTISKLASFTLLLIFLFLLGNLDTIKKSFPKPIVGEILALTQTLGGTFDSSLRYSMSIQSPYCSWSHCYANINDELRFIGSRTQIEEDIYSQIGILPFSLTRREEQKKPSNNSTLLKSDNPVTIIYVYKKNSTTDHILVFDLQLYSDLLKKNKKAIDDRIKTRKAIFPNHGKFIKDRILDFSYKIPLLNNIERFNLINPKKPNSKSLKRVNSESEIKGLRSIFDLAIIEIAVFTMFLIAIFPILNYFNVMWGTKDLEDLMLVYEG